MISIDKYEIIKNADGGQVFKLDYSNKGSESIRVKIVMNDLLFRTQNYNIDFHDIHPNCGHWSTFNSFDTGLTTQFSMGVIITFIDENNNIILKQTSDGIIISSTGAGAQYTLNICRNGVSDTLIVYGPSGQEA